MNTLDEAVELAFIELKRQLPMIDDLTEVGQPTYSKVLTYDGFNLRAVIEAATVYLVRDRADR